MHFRRLTTPFTLFPIVWFGAQLGWAQTEKHQPALPKSDDVNQMKLGEQPLTENVFISLEGAASRGDGNAKVVIVEFSDYQCPYCAVHASQVLPQIAKGYVDTGKVMYVFRDLPVASTHPFAQKAAEAARCAGDQGQYWAMHDRMLSNQSTLDANTIPAHARTLGLDVSAFQACVDSGKYTRSVHQDREEGLKAGVKATPAFFIGVTDPNEPRLKAFSLVTGAMPYLVFKEIIDKLLLSSEKDREKETVKHDRL